MRRRARAATTRTNTRPKAQCSRLNAQCRALGILPWALSIEHSHATAPAHRRCGVVSCCAVCIGQAAAGRHQQPQRPGVQVGVPDGRGGAPAQPAGRGRQAGPPQPPPRNAAGRVLLGGATPKQKNGVWLPGGTPVTQANMKEIPWQPWARGVVADRDANELEPHTRCKPSGVTRPFLTPYGVEIVELQELQRIYIFDIGGPHTYRTIYMDGRSHPHECRSDATTATRSAGGRATRWSSTPSASTRASGSIDAARPTPSRLHTVERLTRTDLNVMQYKVTIDDPGAYTKPWKSGFNLRCDPNVDLFEYICQQMNYAHELMVGSNDSVDRRSPIIP